ncbi:MAG: hypothetical protein Q8O72_04850, partial [Bacteroidales bacterium]|nr:hypothetical protein [Bacteroidales bacterium]
MIEIGSSLTSVLKFKDQVPIFKIELYDTVNTVPSVGLSGYYYNNATHTPLGYVGTDDPYWAQQDATMLFNWDNGIPLNLSAADLKMGDQYSVKWFGKFFAEETGEYRFDAGVGIGGNRENRTDVAMTLDSQQILLPKDTFASTQGQSRVFEKNSWHDITLTFAKPLASKDGSVAFFYKAPRDVGYRILSADVLSTTAAFLTPTVLSGVTSIDVDMNQDQATTANFTITNIQNNTQLTWSDTTQSFGVLKPNRLIKIYQGYLTQTGEEMVQTFIGNLDSVIPSHGSDGISLQVTCRDFSRQLIETLVENFPNKSSYLLPIQMLDDEFGKK